MPLAAGKAARLRCKNADARYCLIRKGYAAILSIGRDCREEPLLAVLCADIQSADMRAGLYSSAAASLAMKSQKVAIFGTAAMAARQTR